MERRRDTTFPVPIVKQRIVYSNSSAGTDITSKPLPLSREMSNALSAVGRLAVSSSDCSPQTAFFVGSWIRRLWVRVLKLARAGVAECRTKHCVPQHSTWPMTPIPPIVFRPNGPTPQTVEVLTKTHALSRSFSSRERACIDRWVMSSLNAAAATWWNDSLGCAERGYQVWVKSSPLDRSESLCCRQVQ